MQTSTLVSTHRYCIRSCDDSARIALATTGVDLAVLAALMVKDILQHLAYRKVHVVLAVMRYFEKIEIYLLLINYRTVRCVVVPVFGAVGAGERIDPAPIVFLQGTRRRRAIIKTRGWRNTICFPLRVARHALRMNRRSESWTIRRCITRPYHRLQMLCRQCASPYTGCLTCILRLYCPK